MLGKTPTSVVTHQTIAFFFILPRRCVLLPLKKHQKILAATARTLEGRIATAFVLTATTARSGAPKLLKELTNGIIEVTIVKEKL